MNERWKHFMRFLVEEDKDTSRQIPKEIECILHCVVDFVSAIAMQTDKTIIAIEITGLSYTKDDPYVFNGPCGQIKLFSSEKTK